MLGLLFIGAVQNQRGTELPSAHPADARGVGLGRLLAKDELFHGREATAAVLLRPVGREPASLGQGITPVDCGLTNGRILRLAVVLPVAFRHAVALGELRLDQGAHLSPEGCLLRRVVPIHSGASVVRDASLATGGLYA